MIIVHKLDDMVYVVLFMDMQFKYDLKILLGKHVLNTVDIQISGRDKIDVTEASIPRRLKGIGQKLCLQPREFAVHQSD